MTRWLVYKHRFNYMHGPDEKETIHRECTLEFIVSINETIADQDVIETAAITTLREIANDIKDDGLVPMYDFGSLSSNQFLDDVKKIFLTNLPDGEKKVHLWLDRDDQFSLWDDGSDVNSLCK